MDTRDGNLLMEQTLYRNKISKLQFKRRNLINKNYDNQNNYLSLIVISKQGYNTLILQKPSCRFGCTRIIHIAKSESMIKRFIDLHP